MDPADPDIRRAFGQGRSRLKLYACDKTRTSPRRLVTSGLVSEGPTNLVRNVAVGFLLHNLFPGVADLRGQEWAGPVLHAGGQADLRLGRAPHARRRAAARSGHI